MSNLPEHPDDRDLEFGPPPPAGLARELRPDERPAQRWAAARDKANQHRDGRKPLKWNAPVDVVAEVMRARLLPRFPWPAEWGELARRCRSYPGDVIGVIGGPGSGKTQFGVQVGRGFVGAERGAVLWSNLELTQTAVNCRIAANLTGRHATEVLETWPEQQLRSALATVSDRWRYVDRERDAEAQLAGYRLAIAVALEIYGSPPLLVIDYLQKFPPWARSRDQRQAAADVIGGITEIAEETGAWVMLISQPSRGNTPALAGRLEIESASDMIGVGAESSQLERDSAVQIALNVFKADDSPMLDAHQLVTKARHTGLEGKVGARYHKAGGRWEELDHLPATPVEIAVEVKKRKRRKPAEDGQPRQEATPTAARAEINGTRAEEAASARRAALIAALRAAGDRGLGGRELRKVRGSGSPTRMRATIAELEHGGRVRSDGGRAYFVK